MKKRSKLAVIGLIVFGILLAFAAIETYFSLLSAQYIYKNLPGFGLKCFQKEDRYFSSLKPNSACHFTTGDYDVSLKTNNHGFISDKNIHLEKPPGIKRVAFIGDSYTMGQGVTQNLNYPSLIGNLLNQKGVKTEIINASMTGVGIDWYYLRLKEKVVSFKPDIVVVGIYLGNDLADLEHSKWSQMDSQGLPVKLSNTLEYVDQDGTRRTTNTPLRYKLPLLRNLHTFIFLAEHLGGPFSPTVFLNGSPCMLQPNCQELDQDINKAVLLLSGMNKLAQNHNFKLLVVLIPWENQLPRQILEKSLVNFFAKSENRHHLSNKIAFQLKDRSIPYLDLLDSFEKYEGSEPVFYPLDRHWTNIGHEIAASAIAKAVEKMLTEQIFQTEEKE